MRIPMRLAFALSALTLICSTTLADDGRRQPGDLDNGTTRNLKLTAADQTDALPVFHGRLAACLFGCRRPVVYYAPVPVYADCFGGSGGAYSPGVAAPITYSVRPVPVQPNVPSYAYRAPTPSVRMPASQAIVSLPRLGVTLSFGNDNGLSVGRSPIGNPLSERFMPHDEMPVLPPIEAPSQQFQYDGGPTAPIPMPRSTRPLPPASPPSAPSIDNRVKLRSSSSTWTAYGERTKPFPHSPNLLVKQRSQ